MRKTCPKDGGNYKNTITNHHRNSIRHHHRSHPTLSPLPHIQYQRPNLKYPWYHPWLPNNPIDKPKLGILNLKP